MLEMSYFSVMILQKCFVFKLETGQASRQVGSNQEGNKSGLGVVSSGTISTNE
jgi:hypothetical protein